MKVRHWNGQEHVDGYAAQCVECVNKHECYKVESQPPEVRDDAECKFRETEEEPVETTKTCASCGGELTEEQVEAGEAFCNDVCRNGYVPTDAAPAAAVCYACRGRETCIELKGRDPTPDDTEGCAFSPLFPVHTVVSATEELKPSVTIYGNAFGAVKEVHEVPSASDAGDTVEFEVEWLNEDGNRWTERHPWTELQHVSDFACDAVALLCPPFKTDTLVLPSEEDEKFDDDKDGAIGFVVKQSPRFMEPGNMVIDYLIRWCPRKGEFFATWEQGDALRPFGCMTWWVKDATGHKESISGRASRQLLKMAQAERNGQKQGNMNETEARDWESIIAGTLSLTKRDGWQVTVALRSTYDPEDKWDEGKHGRVIRIAMPLGEPRKTCGDLITSWVGVPYECRDILRTGRECRQYVATLVRQNCA